MSGRTGSDGGNEVLWAAVLALLIAGAAGLGVIVVILRAILWWLG